MLSCLAVSPETFIPRKRPRELLCARPEDWLEVGDADGIFSAAALRRLLRGPGIHWDSDGRALCLGSYVQHRASGNLAIQPPIGYSHYVDDLCRCLLHRSTGILVRCRPIQPIASFDNPIVLYLYAQRQAFEAICAGSEWPVSALDGGVACSTVRLSSQPPDSFNSKQAILLDSCPRRDVVDRQLPQDAGNRHVADYCIPVLVPDSVGAEVMRNVEVPGMSQGAIDRPRPHPLPEQHQWMGESRDHASGCVSIQDVIAVRWARSGDVACRLVGDACRLLRDAKAAIAEFLSVPPELQQLTDACGHCLQDDDLELEISALELSILERGVLPTLHLATSLRRPLPVDSGSRGDEAGHHPASTRMWKRRRPTAQISLAEYMLSRALLGDATASAAAMAAPPSGYQTNPDGSTLLHLASGILVLAAPVRAAVSIAGAATIAVSTSSRSGRGSRRNEDEEFLALFCYAGETAFRAACSCGPSGELTFELHAMLAEGPKSSCCLGSPTGFLVATSRAPDELDLGDCSMPGSVPRAPDAGEDTRMADALHFCIPLVVPRSRATDVSEDAEGLVIGGLLPHGAFSGRGRDCGDVWMVSSNCVDGQSDDSSPDGFHRWLESHDWRVRRAAIRALAGAAAGGDELAVESVALCLEDEDHRVRAAAARVAAGVTATFAS
mmetsp:Transcript_48981/g.124805  ORF Transcript_48981/g.124805 Transcript_48981/m.124805 type:complete len:668 (+) Transcript_48981:28-2031(+)